MSGQRADGYTREVYEDLRVLGSLVREWRRLNGISQSALEGRSGVDQTTISRLENGKLTGMRLHRLAAIVAALHPRVRRDW